MQRRIADCDHDDGACAAGTVHGRRDPRGAARRTGGPDDLGDGPFVEPLALFLESLEREARLNDIGRLIASERALGHTVNRLGYVNDRKQFPAIAVARASGIQLPLREPQDVVAAAGPDRRLPVGQCARDDAAGQ